jgi:8-amino-7-oxononanoate synthase
VRANTQIVTSGRGITSKQTDHQIVVTGLSGSSSGEAGSRGRVVARLGLGATSARAPRAERFLPKAGRGIGVYRAGSSYLGELRDISRTGLHFVSADSAALQLGAELPALTLDARGRQFECGSCVVARMSFEQGSGRGVSSVALRFDIEQSPLLNALLGELLAPEFVTGELLPDALDGLESTIDATEITIDTFHWKRDRDILAKCASFRPWVDDMMLKQLYQRLFRVTHTGALDHEITVFDPVDRTERPMICFDSNSYLGLHRDPRVVERVVQVTRDVGYGTPSAQLLGGTNRYLRELEAELSDFLGREETIIFPTGFAANTGTISALVRKEDAVLWDRFAHASIHEGCRRSDSRFGRVFAHNDTSSLVRLLEKADQAGCQGKLVVTDGLFSMHGRIAPLPQLVEVTRRHDARLMIDDAHGFGVLGANGRGIEEHYGMPGAVDVLMGTLSKALGAVGGFISGSRDLIYYLRFHAGSSIFTTSLPAATCAGMREALRIVRTERHHRDRLWEHIAFFSPELQRAGFIVPDPVSPIVPVFIGEQRLMFEFSRDLFDAGIKCGSVGYPAVPKGDAILRFTLTARHTREELQYAIDTLACLGKKWGILHRSAEEIREMSARVRTDGASVFSSTAA